jgi:hypothetical protein
MIARLAILAALLMLPFEGQCAGCVTLLVQSSSLPKASALHLADFSPSDLMKGLPALLLPDELTAQDGREAFLERWNAFQSFDAGHLYEQALLRWAHQLNAHFGNDLGSVFLTSVANRASRKFDSSTVFFSPLPSTGDLRLVLSVFRPNDAYDPRTIHKIQTAMASLVLYGLKRFEQDLKNSHPLGPLLEEELAPQWEGDDAMFVYRLRNAESKNYQGPFLRINVEGLPRESMPPNPLGQMDSSTGTPLGILLELPSKLADSFASDILAMQKWLRIYEEQNPETPKP